MRVRKAVIPAAGLGSRFLPATKSVPKELLPIVNRPALEIIAQELADTGIEEIVLVIGPDKEPVRKYFERDAEFEKLLGPEKVARLQSLHAILDKVKFSSALQKEPLGLGHAVLCAKEAVGEEPFAVVLPDDLVRAKVPCLAQIIAAAEKAGTSGVAVEKVPQADVSKYGIVSGKKMKGSEPFSIEEIVEKPPREKAPSQWAIIGRYVLDAAIFTYLEETKPGALGEIQLTDALERLTREKGLMAVPFVGDRIDAGQPPGFIKANLAYAMDDPELRQYLRPYLKELWESS